MHMELQSCLKNRRTFLSAMLTASLCLFKPMEVLGFVSIVLDVKSKVLWRMKQIA